MKTRAWMGWGAVLVVGCLVGGWLAVGRANQGGGGLLPRPTASLALAISPEGPFTVSVSSASHGPARLFPGDLAIELEPGDYFVDVIPAAASHQPKRLKVHLEPTQRLALPVVLMPVPRPARVEPAAPAPEAQEDSAPAVEAPLVEVVPFPPEAPAPAPAPPSPRFTTFPEINRLRLGTEPSGSSPVIRGRVADAKPKLEGEEIDREALARYIRSRKAAIQGCYEKELKRNPALKGTVVVRFVITRLGRASEIGIEQDTMGNEAVASCIKSILRGWVFPFKPEHDVKVTYPFAFSPANP